MTPRFVSSQYAVRVQFSVEKMCLTLAVARREIASQTIASQTIVVRNSFGLLQSLADEL